MTATAPSVPNAHAGPINDLALEKIIEAGHILQNDMQPSDSDLMLILLSAPQIAAELLHRRRAMGVIEDMTDLSNVTFLKSS
jgi:hypothetical protein